MSYLFERKEIGEDYRISIYQDEDAECPCTDWDMLGVYIWNYGYFNDPVSSFCNHEELFGNFDDSNHTICEALQELICKYVSQDSLLRYIKKGKMSSVRMEYNRYNNEWEEYGLDCHDELTWSSIFTPIDLREYDVRPELTENMDKDELMQIISDLAKSIAFKDWSSKGYCQGDYVSGFVYCDKERFSKFCDTNTKNWRKRALGIFESEVNSIGLWMWGDVKGFILEKKVHYKKVFTEIGREPVDDYDWEEVDSCWGEYYEDADELIKDALAENGIKYDDAA